MPLPDQDLLTASAVARLLGVHRASIHRIPRDELPYREHGRQRVRHYDPADVDRYREAQRGCHDGIHTNLAGIIAEHGRLIAEHEARIAAVEERQEAGR